MTGTTRIVRRVVIVDDSRVIQTMLETAFGTRPDFKVVGVASDAKTACDLIGRLRPDVVTIDLCMPYIDGAALLQMTAHVGSTCKVVVSDQVAKSVLMQSRLQSLGASTCFLKRQIIDDPQAFFAKLNATCDQFQAGAKAQSRTASSALALNGPNEPKEVGFPIPRDEAARIKLLHAKELANSLHERPFDLITRHVAEILAFPVCLLTFIDRETQWIKSAYGFQETKMPRGDAFCNYTIVQDSALVVNNAANDNRFAQNRLVVGEPHIRTYVGQPIIVRDGTRIGALCVIDTKIRHIGKPTFSTLANMADVLAEMVDARPLVA
ncbi:response regulator [Sphingomonas oligophenolica]|nr:response regulator [Sphingomonas oligophenolica]